MFPEEVITVSGPDVDVPALREALVRRTDRERFIVGPLLAANPTVEEDPAPEYRERVRALSATAAGERRSADA